MARSDDHFVPVIGGVDLPEDHRRTDLFDLSNVNLHSDLDRQITRLLALHPAIRVAFKNQDLDRISDDAKRAMLSDMNDLLGIKSLKTAPIITSGISHPAQRENLNT